MATVQLTGDDLRIRLTRGERLGGLLRHLDVPLTAVISATAVPDGLRAARGIRAPGVALPGVLKVGTWRGRAGRSYVAVRGGPALRLQLTGFRFDTVLVSAPDAERLAGAVAATAPSATTGPVRDVSSSSDR